LATTQYTSAAATVHRRIKKTDDSTGMWLPFLMLYRWLQRLMCQCHALKALGRFASLNRLDYQSTVKVLHSCKGFIFSRCHYSEYFGAKILQKRKSWCL